MPRDGEHRLCGCNAQHQGRHHCAARRYTLPKGTRFRIDHLPGAGESLLWVADIVAGAVRAEKLGDPRYREIFGERVNDFPVRVS